MILADENIDHELIAALRAAGFPVTSIYESHRGLKDEEIIQLSRNPPRFILTEDKDFGEWVFAHGIRDVSILFLRYEFKETELLSKNLIQLLRTRLLDLTGKFTTIAIHKIRIRAI